MKFCVPKLSFGTHFTHILDIMTSNPSKIVPDDDSVHHITQVDDSGDECERVEYSPSIFGGVLTQEEVEKIMKKNAVIVGKFRPLVLLCPS